MGELSVGKNLAALRALLNAAKTLLGADAIGNRLHQLGNSGRGSSTANTTESGG